MLSLFFSIASIDRSFFSQPRKKKNSVQARRAPPPLGQQGRPLQQPAADLFLRLPAAVPPGGWKLGRQNHRERQEEEQKEQKAGDEVGRPGRGPRREQARRLAARALLPRARSPGEAEDLLSGPGRGGRGEAVESSPEPLLVRALFGRLADLGICREPSEQLRGRGGGGAARLHAQGV